MKAISRFLLILVCLSFASLACKTFLPTQKDAKPGDILFQDDFSDPSSGWKRVKEDKGETDYANGVYRIVVNQPNTDVWSNPGLNFSDVRVEVDATKVGGDDNNDLGLICRLKDSANFYFFIISSDGYYGIGKVKDGTQELIDSHSMRPSEAIQKGTIPNHIRADCTGDTLALYVNNEKLSEITDEDFKSGDVGLIAGAFGVPGTDIHYDNFEVIKP